jgi:hypothetical protein
VRNTIQPVFGIFDYYSIIIRLVHILLHWITMASPNPAVRQSMRLSVTEFQMIGNWKRVMLST